MKKLLEMRNLLKEMIKGTSLEPFTKSVFELVNPPKGSALTNKQDNAWTNQILLRVLTQHSNCIDIGCNTGDFLSQILDLAPLGYHYAFEPLPRLATRLKKRFPNTDVRQVALSDAEGEATFCYFVSAPALSRLKTKNFDDHNSNEPIESITVKTERLDDILAPDLKIHFIKIDVEGVESQVFKGALRTLKMHRPYIVFEHGGKDARVYDLLINQCGLQIFELKSWLDGLAPLSQDEFTKCYAWNFLAAP